MWLTMLITLVLVVGVIYLFLHNGSATLIPALALPFSILGTFAVMQMMDYSLDNLSMMALILSIGFVVDDAIVMLENIVRHMEAGETPLESGAQGIEGDRLHDPDDDDLAGGGVHPDSVHGRHPGRLFREFAVTITTAVLIPGVVSVTLTPMLCSRFLKVVHARRASRASWIARSTRCVTATAGACGFVLRHRLVMLVVFFGVLGATVGMYGDRPEGLHPGQRQRLAQHQSARRPGHLVLRDGRTTRSASPTSSGKNPYIDAMMVNTGGGCAGRHRAA